MRRIFIDSQSYPMLIRGGPEEQRYEERCLLEASENDLAIFGQSPDSAYLHFLQDSFGWKLPQIWIACGTGANIIEKIESHPEIFERLKSQIKEWHARNEEMRLESFAVTPLEHAFAQKFGITLYGFPLDCLRYGTKSGFRKLARENGLRIPDGEENLTTIEEIQSALLKLSGKYSTAIIKNDDGLGGMGNVVVNLSDDLRNIPEIFQKMAKAGGYFVAEAYIPSRYSASFQIELLSRENFSITAVEQLVENGKFVGSKYPLIRGIPPGIIGNLKRTIRFLEERGCLGYFNIEGVVTAEGETYFIELNARKTGVTYPLAAVRKLFPGESLPAFITRHVNLKNPITFREIQNKLEPLLFSKQKRFGIVPYNVGLLPWKQLEISAIAPEPDEADLIMNVCLEILE